MSNVSNPSLLARWFQCVGNEENMAASKELVRGNVEVLEDVGNAEIWDTWDFLGLLEGMGRLPAGTFVPELSGPPPLA